MSTSDRTPADQPIPLETTNPDGTILAEREAKFAWEPGTFHIIIGDWHCAYANELGGETLVQDWDGFVRFLHEFDPRSLNNFRAAVFRFLATHPEASHMPPKLRDEMQGRGFLPVDPAIFGPPPAGSGPAGSGR